MTQLDIFRIRPVCVRLSFLAVLIIMWVLASTGPANAQDLRKFEPAPVPPQVEAPAGGALNPQPAPPPFMKDERVIVAALRGLIFVDRKEAVAKKAEAPPGGIDASRLPLLQTADFKKVVEPYLGKPVSLAALNRLITAVNVYYRQADMPFVSVTLPEQDITTGVVQLLVVEGKAGRVRVEGAKWFSEDQYLSGIRLKPGDPIRLSILNEDIAWINKNPYRQANVFFDQGESVGGTNLVVRTNERIPVRVFAGYNNNGSESTNRNQLLGGFNWGNVFGLGHQLNYQYTTSPDFKESRAHSGSYMIPLAWRDMLTLSGSYSRIKPKMEEPFDRNGMSGQVSIRYDTDLPSIGPLKQAAGIIFDYKVTDNNLLFGGIPVTDNRTDILEWSGVYSGALADAWGSSNLGLRLTASPGGLTSRNSTEYFAISRTFAKANYVYGTADLARMQPLPWGCVLQLSGHLQLASGNLLGSEQLGLGGVNSVRGYNEGIVYGDSGYLLRAELHTPPLPVHRVLPFSPPVMPIEFLAFYDYGTVGNRLLLPNESRWNTLKSTGVGLRYAVDRYVALSLDYGWNLADFPGVDYGSRAHFSLMISY